MEDDQVIAVDIAETADGMEKARGERGRRRSEGAEGIARRLTDLCVMHGTSTGMSTGDPYRLPPGRGSAWRMSWTIPSPSSIDGEFTVRDLGGIQLYLRLGNTEHRLLFAGLGAEVQASEWIAGKEWEKLGGYEGQSEEDIIADQASAGGRDRSVDGEDIARRLDALCHAHGMMSGPALGVARVQVGLVSAWRTGWSIARYGDGAFTVWSAERIHHRWHRGRSERDRTYSGPDAEAQVSAWIAGKGWDKPDGEC